MSDLACVYRSTHPDVLAARDAWHAAITEWPDRAAALLDELYLPGHNLLIHTGTGGKRWLGGVTRDGIAPPQGWRQTTAGEYDVIQPDKRTREGRAAAALLDECRPPDEQNRWLPGMPPLHWGDQAMATPGVQEMDGAVWATWSITVPELAPDADPEQGRRGDHVDLARWERVPRSRYYAAVEAGEDTV